MATIETETKKKIALPQGITALFWDFDGTLLDTSRAVAGGFNHALKGMGRPTMSVEDLLVYMGPPVITTMRESFHMTEEEARKADALFYEYFIPNGTKESRFMPGMEDALRRGYELGFLNFAATMKMEREAEACRVAFELDRYMKKIYCVLSEDGVDEKENILGRGLAEEGLDPARSVMIGDRATDIEAAKLLRTHSIGVTFGNGSREELMEAGAEILVDSPRELTLVLEEMAGARG